MPGRSGGAYERRTLRPGIARDALRSRGAADASGSFRTDQSRALRAGRPSQALRADRTDWSHWASQTSHAGALCARFTGGALRASGTNWANCPCGTNLNFTGKTRRADRASIADGARRTLVAGRTCHAIALCA
jgi:hypothetical protein